MDLIPLDATLVRGSHGGRPADPADWPMLIAPQKKPLGEVLPATGVRDTLLALVDDGRPATA